MILYPAGNVGSCLAEATFLKAIPATPTGTPMSNRSFVLVAAVAVCLVLGACGSALDRDDAVAALLDAGATSTEASCMADSLLVLDELDLADAQVVLSERDKAILLDTKDRCQGSIGVTQSGVSTEVLSGSDASRVEPGGGAAFMGDDDDEEFTGAGSDAEDAGDSAEAAIARGTEVLKILGRSDRFATCVVDELVAIDAIDVMLSDDFGSGLSPLEANAYAACAGR